MIRVALNDLFQRIMTLNKREQRANLQKRVGAVHFPNESKILDFGCGTALFAKIFMNKKFTYYGYDIDERLIAYANRLNARARFLQSKGELKKESPYDLILANCCFHHIADTMLALELGEIRSMLKSGGILIMIDILLSRYDTFVPRLLFRKLERGVHIRSLQNYRSLIEKYFLIRKCDIERSHLFSIRNFPIYNDLLVFECQQGGSFPLCMSAPNLVNA